MRAPRRVLGLLSFVTVGFAFVPSASAQALFELVQDALPSTGCGGTGCWTTYARLIDIDGDLDLDVLLPSSAGGQSQGMEEPFAIYRNDGNFTFVDVSAEAVGGFVGWPRQVATADITGDGFVDMYAPDTWGGTDMFWINDGTGKFVDEAATRLAGVHSHAGAARFGDVDNDGDLDLVVTDDYSEANGGVVAHLYLNDGDGVFSESPAALPTSISKRPVDLDLLDVDGDFDLDVFLNSHSFKSSLWLNDGTGTFTEADDNIPGEGGNRDGPVACDVDGDGDLDLWQDDSSSNVTEQLLINDGNGKYSDQTDTRVTGNVNGEDDGGLACVDVDGDGDFDAVIFNYGPAERLLVNDGTGHFTLQADAFPSTSDTTFWADFGDLDGDGRIDLVTAQGETNFSTDKILRGIAPVPVDTVDPTIRAVEALDTLAADTPTVIRFGVSDEAVTDGGPRLERAYLKIVSPAGSEIEASFIGGDLFRAVLPAHADGAVVSFQTCATDRRGNDGCSETFSYTVGASPDAGGTSGVGGSDAGGTAGSSGSDAGEASGGDGSSAGGSDGGTPSTNDSSGCGCSIPGRNATPSAALFILLAILSLYTRRRAR